MDDICEARALREQLDADPALQRLSVLERMAKEAPGRNINDAYDRITRGVLARNGMPTTPPTVRYVRARLWRQEPDPADIPTRGVLVTTMCCARVEVSPDASVREHGPAFSAFTIEGPAGSCDLDLLARAQEVVLEHRDWWQNFARAESWDRRPYNEGGRAPDEDLRADIEAHLLGQMTMPTLLERDLARHPCPAGKTSRDHQKARAGTVRSALSRYRRKVRGHQ